MLKKNVRSFAKVLIPGMRPWILCQIELLSPQNALLCPSKLCGQVMVGPSPLAGDEVSAVVQDVLKTYVAPWHNAYPSH